MANNVHHVSCISIKWKNEFKYCVLFSSHYSTCPFTSVNELLYYCHINCTFLLLVSDFSAFTLKRVIISVYNFLFTDAVWRNWGATDNKLQTVTSYKTLKQAVNSSVTLSPSVILPGHIYLTGGKSQFPIPPPKKPRGDTRNKLQMEGQKHD